MALINNLCSVNDCTEINTCMIRRRIGYHSPYVDSKLQCVPTCSVCIVYKNIDNVVFYCVFFSSSEPQRKKTERSELSLHAQTIVQKVVVLYER